jgi:hypothetical protein
METQEIILTIEDFSNYLNQFMKIKIDDNQTIECELLEVRTIENYSPIERKPFSIMLRSNQKKEYYDQGIYALQHPSLGSINIFFVPKGFDDIGMQYEAIFS